MILPVRIASIRFNRENSGASVSEPYPWFDAAPFVKRLNPGWKVVGWARNEDLSPAVRRSSGGPFIAIMFTTPEGFDCWFHFGDYAYRFIESV